MTHFNQLVILNYITGGAIEQIENNHQSTKLYGIKIDIQTTFELKIFFSKSDKKFEKMFKQYAVIYLFGMQDVNASVDIFNDMKMLKMNEVSSSEKKKNEIKYSIFIRYLSSWVLKKQSLFKSFNS